MSDSGVSNGAIIVLMSLLFLGLGYLGVPVAFALIAGVLVATALTPVSFASMIGQLFHGIDSEALLAVPFFLLVGELMTSADVTQRMSPSFILSVRTSLANSKSLPKKSIRKHRNWPLELRWIDGHTGRAAC